MNNTLLDIWLTCNKIVGYDNILEVFSLKSFRCLPPWIWVTFDAIIVVTKRSCAYTFSVSVINFNYPKHLPLSNPFFTWSPNPPWFLTWIQTLAIKIYKYINSVEILLQLFAFDTISIFKTRKQAFIGWSNGNIAYGADVLIKLEN